MKYLHTMIRISDVKSVEIGEGLGLKKHKKEAKKVDTL